MTEQLLVAGSEPRLHAASPAEVLELLWQRRSWLWRCAAIGFVTALLLAFVIPKQYESTARLMPPDSQSATGAGLAAAIMGTLPAGSAGIAGNFLGIKSPGAMFVGVLQSRTVQDDLINQFDLRSAYGMKQYGDARKKLAGRTAINEDTKSGIITITVTDNNPERARALAAGYVEQLNRLVSKVSTSSARREREFLEERLQKVKVDLDEATLRLSQFSSRNMTFDPQLQGRAMLDAAATLQGQLGGYRPARRQWGCGGWGALKVLQQASPGQRPGESLQGWAGGAAPPQGVALG